MTSDHGNLIGAAIEAGTGTPWHAIAAETGSPLEGGFTTATPAQVDRACALADAAFDAYRQVAPALRAAFLDAIAAAILGLGDALVTTCMAETGLPRGRIEGERARTIGQLRLFADVLRQGEFLGVRIDPAQPDRKPLPRPDLRLRHVALGPVAVFGASNFPLAFSVAGGDTASALAAGCPVVVKAHPAHPGTSALVGRAVRAAVAECGLPEGVFSLLFDDGYEVGQRLAADPRIGAVGFTGSRRGGTALMRIAAGRAVPIPVFAEMSSVNPVILFPAALARRGAEIGQAFAASLTLGGGQFCTNPGLLLAVEGAGLDTFLAGASAALARTEASTMLTPSIGRAYDAAVEDLSANPAVATVARGRTGGAHQGRAGLFATTAEAFLADPRLADEVFGATALLLRCRNLAEIRSVLVRIEGQLTAALHLDPEDHDAAGSLMPLLERKVGRILVNGFGTGVEVSHAMVHGGPYPATSDGRSTSVGSLAIARFLRPVSYQDIPDALLPDELRSTNPGVIPRRVDGCLASGR